MAPEGEEHQDTEYADRSSPVTRARAKRACRECNLRRVRCNVTEAQPCKNCAASGANCEVLPSRRGKYPRKSHRQRTAIQAANALKAASASGNANDESSFVHPTASAEPEIIVDPEIARSHDEVSAGIPARTPSPSADSAAPGSLYFGESNFLTLVPGQSQETNRGHDRQEDKQKARLLFPITNTPQSMAEGTSPASIDHLSAGTSRYLRDEGALTFPDSESCVLALKAYFAWFHPCFPILDRAEFTRKMERKEVSYLLLQAMLFISTTYCDQNTIISMGFKDRSEAKSLLYTRARLLFHADWEKDPITLIQSLFLLSFWRGGPSDVRDVRYWLGVVIGLAESYGLHRSAKFTTRDPHKANIRRRVWWSIYVRERQAAASLGLPSRIRDKDCDIEPLSPSDLESEVEGSSSSTFGSCKPEHITYAIKMVEIAKILGQVIDVNFTPGRPPSTPGQARNLDDTLEAWKRSLPDEMMDGIEDGNASVWSHLLHLAYNHLRILLYRHHFIREGDSDKNGKIAVIAASKISRIAEDMLTQGTLRHGQMHLITSLFAALCIHAISIRRGVDVSKRIAENRAQMCLLGLQEIQKYWRINNNVLDLFLRYLDVSIAKRLQGAAQTEATLQNIANQEPQPTLGEHVAIPVSSPHEGERVDFPTPQQSAETRAFEDQYFDLLYGPWEGGDGVVNLGLALQADDPMQMEGLNFLGRSL